MPQERRAVIAKRVIENEEGARLVADTAADARPVRIALIGVGKMGLSHLAILRALDEVEVVGVCDSSDYLTQVLNKYTGVPTFTSVDRMLRDTAVDAVVIATPTASHAELVRSVLGRGLHVFCEKPLTLAGEESAELAQMARDRGLVAQVGYHNRFVATFQEVKRLLDEGAIGTPTHILAEAYGPVVLQQKGQTWRSRRASGGGCLYDYAAHPLNLINWYVGSPTAVRGSILNSIFSADTDDEVYSTLLFEGGLSAQLSVNWSDESYRKMSTSVSVTGTNGRIFADRQEIRAYLRDSENVPAGYQAGWNVLYTTDLTKSVSFYLRGEEYSAQLEAFVAAVGAGEPEPRENSFLSAAETDRAISSILRDADHSEPAPDRPKSSPRTKLGRRRPRLLSWRRS